MMPPFVVFPTNRIAHFVEVSLYLFYLAQQVKLLFPGLLPERELAVIPCSGLSLKLLLPGFRRFLLFLQLSAEQ